MGLEVKKSAAQILMGAALMLALEVSRARLHLAGFGASTSAIPFGHIFADTQNAGIYKEFINANNKM